MRQNFTERSKKYNVTKRTLRYLQNNAFMRQSYVLLKYNTQREKRAILDLINYWKKMKAET